MNNSVQKLVGEVIRVVLGFLCGTSPMPHPPCTAFITEENRFLISGWVILDLKQSKISFFYFLKIVRLFRQDIVKVKVGSSNVLGPW